MYKRCLLAKWLHFCRCEQKWELFVSWIVCDNGKYSIRCLLWLFPHFLQESFLFLTLGGVFFFFIWLVKLLPLLLKVVRNFPMFSVCTNFVFFVCVCVCAISLLWSVSNPWICVWMEKKKQWNAVITSRTHTSVVLLCHCTEGAISWMCSTDGDTVSHSDSCWNRSPSVDLFSLLGSVCILYVCTGVWSFQASLWYDKVTDRQAEECGKIWRAEFVAGSEMTSVNLVS